MILLLQSLAGKKSNDNNLTINNECQSPINIRSTHTRQLSFTHSNANQLSPKLLSKLSNIDESLEPFISNVNDPLIKILSFDQGNPYKDFKAILQSMKQEMIQQKQRNPLIYAQTQNDFKDLLSNLKIQNINVDKIIKILPKNIFNNKNSKEENNKIKLLKKHNQQTFNNYDRLLKFSMRQRAKDQYNTQSSKRNKYFMMNKKNILQKDRSTSLYQKQQNRQNSLLSTQQIKNNGKSKQIIYEQKSALKKFVEKKKFQLNLVTSSKLQNEEEKIQTLMKSRKNCQDILQEALMFERYFDGMKKDKIRNLYKSKERQNFSNLQRVKTQGDQMKTKYKHRNRTSRTGSNLSTYQSFANQNLNKTSQSNPNPIHIRLQKPSHLNIQKFSQKQYNREVYVQQRKKKQNYEQMNKISDQIVQKKNYKNNLVIKTIINFMRQNCTQQMASIKQIQNSQQKINDQKNQQRNFQLNESKLKKSLKKSLISLNNQSKERLKKAKTSHPKDHIAILPQTLRKIFLLYSNKDSDDLQTPPFSLISNQNLLRFLNDFQINYEEIKTKNDKFFEIIEKKNIDQFQFVQMIHILAVQIILNKSGNQKKLNNSPQLSNKKELNIKQLPLFNRGQSRIQIHTEQIQQNNQLNPQNNCQINNKLQNNSSINKQQKHSPLYTNIHEFLFSYILSPKYDKHLFLAQNLIYYQHQKVSIAFMNKQFKVSKFRQRIQKCICLYFQQQKISQFSAKLQKKFTSSIQFIVQILWFMKIYPKYINKKTIKFYIQYLKQQLGTNNISTISIIHKVENNKFIVKYKTKGVMVIENVLCLLIAKLAIDQFDQIKNYQSNHTRKQEDINNINNNININTNNDNDNDNDQNNLNVYSNTIKTISSHVNHNIPINQITFSAVYQIKFKSIIRNINSVIYSYEKQQQQKQK